MVEALTLSLYLQQTDLPAAVSYSLRFLVFAALGLALLGLPQYSQVFAPAACAVITQLSGWFAGHPEVVHDIRLQATPEAYYVEVSKECLGLEAWMMFAAAVLAFSAPLRRRMVVLLSSIILMVLLNALRIASLYHIGLWSLTAAEWAHRWLLYLPFLILYMTLLYVIGTVNEGGFAAMRKRLDRVELEYWIKALALLTASLTLWHLYGPACVETALLNLTKLLIRGLSFGYISDVGFFIPRHVDSGWQFVLPLFSQGIDGVSHSAEIPFNFIAYLLFPLVSFVLCQSLLGKTRQWRFWLYGVVAGILWYGLGLVVTVVHIQSIAAMQISSPFSPYIAPTYTLTAPPGLPVLFYGSGWLFEMLFTLSKVIGFALWAELAQRNRFSTEVEAQEMA